MKQYIALIDNKQIGPNTIKELIALGLTGDTYVWNPDLANWIRASETEDFKSTFAKKSRNEVPTVEPRNDVKPNKTKSTHVEEVPYIVTKRQWRNLLISYIIAAILGFWLGLKGVYNLAYLSEGQATKNEIHAIFFVSAFLGLSLLISGLICKRAKKTKVHKDWKAVLLGSVAFFIIGIVAYSAYVCKGKPTDEYNLFLGGDEKYTATPGDYFGRNALIDNWGNIVIEESDCIYRIEDKDTKEIKYLIVNFIDSNVARFDLYKKSESGLALESTKKFRYFNNKEDAENSNEYYADADNFVSDEYGSEDKAYHSKYVYYNPHEIQ